MGKEVYVVTFGGGLRDDDEVELYLLGVYGSEEDANLAIKKTIESESNPIIRDMLNTALDTARIHSVKFGETLPVDVKWGLVSTDAYLGNIIE